MRDCSQWQGHPPLAAAGRLIVNQNIRRMKYDLPNKSNQNTSLYNNKFVVCVAFESRPTDHPTTRPILELSFQIHTSFSLFSSSHFDSTGIFVFGFTSFAYPSSIHTIFPLFHVQKFVIDRWSESSDTMFRALQLCSSWISDTFSRVSYKNECHPFHILRCWNM